MERRGGPGWLEVFGLRPVGPGLRAAAKAIGGTPYRPPIRWGPSSLRILKPWVSLPTWLGRTAPGRRLWVYNLANRVPQPRHEGYSVAVTHARDFQGGRWTYDGHAGTDFAAPVGTTVVAPAPGVVLRVANDFDHGGRKVCVDHGGGLLTGSCHLSRALVAEGDRVARGQALGLSGASGMEFLLFFPWVAPHLHFEVWLGGEAVDPYARPGEVSLWRRRNDPEPANLRPVPGDEDFTPTEWSAAGVEAAVRACRDPEARALFWSCATLPRRAAELVFWRNSRPALFRDVPPLLGTAVARRPILDLPFAPDEVSGSVLPRVREP